MKYEEIIEGYTPELQLMDALDLLKHYHPDAAEILNSWAVDSKTDETIEELPQRDPTL